MAGLCDLFADRLLNVACAMLKKWAGVNPSLEAQKTPC